MLMLLLIFQKDSSQCV